MAKISSSRKESATPQARKKATKIAPEDFDKIRAQLVPGETLRPDGRLCYRVTRADYDGGDYVPPIYGNSLQELRQKKKELLQRLDRRLSAKDTRITVDELHQRWRDAKKGWVRDNTYNNYCYMYDHFVKNTPFGRSRATSIKKSSVLSLYNNLVDARGVKVHSLEALQNVLHQMFEILKDDDIIASNPVDKALYKLKKSAKLGKSERVALTIPEQCVFFEYLLRTPKESRWKRLFLVLLGTGLRIAELAALRWCDIDFENGVIRVEHSLVNFPHPGQKPSCTYEMHDPKTEAGYRTIPMFPFVREALLEERAWQEETGEHSVLTVNGYSDFVFFNRFGMPVHQGIVNKAIRRIIRDCNEEILNSREKDPVLVPPFSCHILRHTCATRLIESGLIHPIAVQAFMGHASLDTTMDIYVTCTENFKKKSFGIEQKGKRVYKNIFDDALKCLKPADGVSAEIPLFSYDPQAYSPSVSSIESSRSQLGKFTQTYTNTTHGEDFTP